jgi:hypothetical protein
LGDIGKCKDVDVPLKLEYELSPKAPTSVEMRELRLEILGILSYVLISISLMYVPLPEQPFVVSDNISMVVPDSSMLLRGGAEFR